MSEMSKAASHLALAREQLERVQSAWDVPTDWSDLTVYGFYCLENAVVAAATHLRMPVVKTHQSKAAVAEQLHREHALPDVSGLLQSLNAARKAVSYGDMAMPSLDAEEVAIEVETFVDEVSALLESE